MLEKRLQAYELLKTMPQPRWANVKYDEINLQNIKYYSAPTKKEKLNSLDEVDPEILKTLKRLGISVEEQKRLTGVAVDVVIDSVSVSTSFKDRLAKDGIIFCSMSKQFKTTAELVKIPRFCCASKR